MKEQFDWRLEGAMDVVKVSGDEGRISPGSTCTMVKAEHVQLTDGRMLVLPIPNATAMMLKASERAFLDAQDLLKGAEQRSSGFTHMKSHSEAIDIAEHLTLSVFAAYTSLECFANEWIPAWLTYRKSDRNGDHKVIGKEEMERVLPLSSKLDHVLPSVFRVKSPKGEQVWESFVKLEKLRNRVVHMKQADREACDDSADSVWRRLFTLPAPYTTAKRIVNWYMADAPRVPGLAYDQYRPVMPRWFFECPIES